MATAKRGPRLGLCCTFLEAPIRFRTTTARYLGTLKAGERRAFLGALLLDNAAALERAVAWCRAHGVGAFRITSQLFPVYTHPAVGYRWQDLPTAAPIAAALRRVRLAARADDLRLSFHPDQFVVPGSLSEAVVRASLAELEYQGEVATLVGATQITLHGGGAEAGKEGGKARSLARLQRGLDRLSDRARQLVVLENDDRVYTPRDLLPLCQAAGLRFVYDVHHHRCLPDGLSIEEATERASATWGEAEPWMHVSSPAEGWRGSNPRPHHDRVFLRDFPALWRQRRITVDVEAKDKEVAVLTLARALRLAPPLRAVRRG